MSIQQEVHHTAIASLAAYASASAEFAERTREEARLNDDLAILEAKLVAELLGTENVATGKPHSVSSAEAVVRTHPQVLEQRRVIRDAVFAKNTAQSAATYARLAVDLEAALLRSLVTVEAA